MSENKTTIGPVQLLAIGFGPEAKFEGKILSELERLDRMNTIRLLDLLFVKKDEKTNDLIALSIQGESLGAIIGALMGFDFEEGQKKLKQTQTETDGNAFGLSTKQIAQIGEQLKPGMAAGILLIEHVWARDLKQAIRGTGGIPIAEGFLTPEAIAAVADEIKGMAETMDQLKEAEKHDQPHARVYN